MFRMLGIWPRVEDIEGMFSDTMGCFRCSIILFSMCMCLDMIGSMVSPPCVFIKCDFHPRMKYQQVRGQMVSSMEKPDGKTPMSSSGVDRDMVDFSDLPSGKSEFSSLVRSISMGHLLYITKKHVYHIVKWQMRVYHMKNHHAWWSKLKIPLVVEFISKNIIGSLEPKGHFDRRRNSSISKARKFFSMTAAEKKGGEASVNYSSIYIRHLSALVSTIWVNYLLVI